MIKLLQKRGTISLCIALFSLFLITNASTERIEKNMQCPIILFQKGGNTGLTFDRTTGKIDNIEKNSEANKNGVQKNWIITHVNGQNWLEQAYIKGIYGKNWKTNFNPALKQLDLAYKNNTPIQIKFVFNFLNPKNEKINLSLLQKILYEFLKIKQLLILRLTCKDFRDIICLKNGRMVTPCLERYYNPNIRWLELKIFNHRSISTLPQEMVPISELKNILVPKIYAKEIISWFYEQMSIDDPNSIQKYFPKINFLKDRFKIWTDDGVRYIYTQILATGSLYFGTGRHYRSGLLNFLTSPFIQPVKIMFSNFSAFTALLENDTIISFGEKAFGGEVSIKAQKELKGEKVKMIFSASTAFAALCESGKIVAWGNKPCGGEIPHKALEGEKIKMIFSTANAFLVLCESGNVVAWGLKTFGGEIPPKIREK